MMTLYGLSLNTLTDSTKQAPPQTSGGILNVDPTSGAVNVGCGWNENAWNSWPQAGVQGSG